MAQKLIIDCATGDATYLDLSADEEADLTALQAQQTGALAARDAQHAADQQAVIAGLTALGQPDAAAALARLLGMPAPPPAP